MTEENMTAEEVAVATGGKEVADPTPVDNDGWEQVNSEMGKTIRWRERAKDEKEEANTIYIGPEFIGLYVEKRENVGENAANIYQFKTIKYGMIGVWDTTVLKDKMKRIYEGNEVRIVCKGEQKPKAGGKAYLVFDVYQRQPSVEFLAQLGETKKEDIDPSFD